MKNLGLKIFSLIVAILLSYFIHRDSNEGVIGVTVPVELRGLPDNKIVIKPLIRQTQVSIKGPSYLLSQIYASPPTFRVKVRSDTGNRMVAALKASDLALPPSVTVVRVDPSEMEFVFDNIVKKEVPVKVVQIGTPSSAGKVGEVVVEPSRVIITGPESELARINAIETEPVNMRDVSDETESEITLKFDSKLSDISSKIVHVRFNFASLKTERKFEDIPVEVRSLAGEMGMVQPGSVNVEISGAKDKVASIRNEDILPYVRLSSGVNYGSEAHVQIDLPKGISLIKMEPAEVRIIKSSTGKKVVKSDGSRK